MTEELRARVWLVLTPQPALLLAACNAVLGIDAPVGVLDMAADAGHADVDDAGGEDAPDTGVRAVEAGPHAWAEWPMPNPGSEDAGNTQTYSIHVDGVVRDMVTQLEWQQSVDDEARTWSEAQGYCEGLALAGGGFRVPSRIELLSLLDFTRTNPSIDAAAFPEAPLDAFWSASRFAGTRANAWLINFQFSTSATLVAHTSEKHRVRCVR